MYINVNKHMKHLDQNEKQKSFNVVDQRILNMNSTTKPAISLYTEFDLEFLKTSNYDGIRCKKSILPTKHGCQTDTSL